MTIKNKALYQRLIEQKIYRIRRKRTPKTVNNKISSKFDSVGSIRRFYTKFVQQLDKAGYICKEYAKSKIYVPKFFSFKDDYNGSIVFFKELMSSYVLSNGSITISFSKCNKSSIANFSILDIVLENLYEIKDYYNRSKYCICNKSIKIEHSKYDIKTNKYLHSFLNIQLPKEQDDGSHFLKMPLQKGKRKNFKENPKTKVSSLVVDFINKSTVEAGAMLNVKGRHAINGLLGEVLSNAEDHSTSNSYWYVDAISFIEQQEDTEVVDLNLAIMNVGPSMYEGFEATKTENEENYNICSRLYDIHKSKFTLLKRFERESLFTMYILNDGISRLKFKDESRGNGTMRFLESFIALGSFGLSNPKFMCQLNVLSGHTTITCDNDIHYYSQKEINVLSLNSEKDIKELPDQKYLSYNREYFPGTILECHIYLNKDYFEQITNK